MKLLFPTLLTLLFLAAACEVETEFLTGDAVELRYSTDTLTFDTVFAARGSATRLMKIYNDADEPVRIDRISVEGRTGVSYIFNVDGLRGPEVTDAVIFANDSIFVFVEVQVDPTAPEDVSPFIAEDRLQVETGNNLDEVVLLAYGQNANYLNDFRRGEFFGITCDNATAVLTDERPIVIFGSLFIDSCVVQVPAGNRIFFHGGVQRNELVGGNGFFNDGFIFVQEDGSLQLLGEPDNPVILRTDRLEERFRESPAKYRGLIFGAGSEDNVIRHAEIYNAIAGVTADSLAEVEIENSIIAYSGGPAVTGYQSNLEIRNSLFHDNFGNAIQMIKGGNLTLEHCTVANYGVDASALALQNFSCDANGQNCLAAPLNVRVRNSILSGSRGSELLFADGFSGMEPSQWNVLLTNSVVRTNEVFLSELAIPEPAEAFYTEVCQGCYNLTFGDPLFADLNADDYQLDSLSVALDLGRRLNNLPLDILGNERNRDTPDAGAYERVE